MPNGIFPVPTFRTIPPPQQRTPMSVRIRTRLQRDRLDAALAVGADPKSSPALALRAAQLRSRAGRARLANALVEAVGESRMGDPVTIRRRPQRAEVRAAADELLTLASRLREATPVDVAGAARIARLVNNRKSPLYRAGTRELRDALAEAHGALIPPHEVAHDLLEAA